MFHNMVAQADPSGSHRTVQILRADQARQQKQSKTFSMSLTRLNRKSAIKICWWPQTILEDICNDRLANFA